MYLSINYLSHFQQIGDFRRNKLWNEKQGFINEGKPLSFQRKPSI